MRVVTQNQGEKRSGRGRLFQNEVHLWKLNIHMVAQVVKNLPAVLETWVQSLGQEDTLEKGNGYPLQYSCLENPMDSGAWGATVHGVTKSRT